MRLMRFLVGLAVVIMAATVVMYIVSFWTDETLGGPVYSTRLALVLILLAVLLRVLAGCAASGRGSIWRCSR